MGQHAAHARLGEDFAPSAEHEGDRRLREHAARDLLVQQRELHGEEKSRRVEQRLVAESVDQGLRVGELHADGDVLHIHVLFSRGVLREVGPSLLYLDEPPSTACAGLRSAHGSGQTRCQPPLPLSPLHGAPPPGRVGPLPLPRRAPRYRPSAAPAEHRGHISGRRRQGLLLLLLGEAAAAGEPPIAEGRRVAGNTRPLPPASRRISAGVADEVVARRLDEATRRAQLDARD
mmetsp:Transcript_89807/g.258886  ORF Transcript_89807/g.258886 Transcript_89807/m.258886 type:complete len:232 (-) Transcript_89807:715-1410(-)